MNLSLRRYLRKIFDHISVLLNKNSLCNIVMCTWSQNATIFQKLFDALLINWRCCRGSISRSRISIWHTVISFQCQVLWWITCTNCVAASKTSDMTTVFPVIYVIFKEHLNKTTSSSNQAAQHCFNFLFSTQQYSTHRNTQHCFLFQNCIL